MNVGCCCLCCEKCVKLKIENSCYVNEEGTRIYRKKTGSSSWDNKNFFYNGENKSMLRFPWRKGEKNK